MGRRSGTPRPSGSGFRFGGGRNIPAAQGSSGLTPNNIAVRLGENILDTMSGKRSLMMRQATNAIDASTRLAEQDESQKQFLDLIPTLKQNDILDFKVKGGGLSFMTHQQKGLPNPNAKDSGTPTNPGQGTSNTETDAPEGSTESPQTPPRKKRKPSANVNFKDIQAGVSKMTHMDELVGLNPRFDSLMLNAQSGDAKAKKRLSKMTAGMGTKPAFPENANEPGAVKIPKAKKPKKNGNTSSKNGNKKKTGGM